MVVTAYWLLLIPFGILDPIAHIWHTLKDRNLLGNEAGRCYIYSEKDAMVDWHDVELHARDAVERGFTVRTEKFQGSGHVAHARIDGERRYWAIVRDLWQAGQSGLNAFSS